MNEASSRDESRAADDIPKCGRMAREIRRPSVPVCFFEATKDILIRTQKKKKRRRKGEMESRGEQTKLGTMVVFTKAPTTTDTETAFVRIEPLWNAYAP